MPSRKTHGGAMQRLEGKRAIVTGAGNGIGRAIPLRLASEGARVVLADVNEGDTGNVASEIDGETLVHKTDVTSDGDVEALVNRTVSEWGGLDVMVNNAGVGVAGRAGTTTGEKYDRGWDVCVRGTLLGLKNAVPPLKDTGGGPRLKIS